MSVNKWNNPRNCSRCRINKTRGDYCQVCWDEITMTAEKARFLGKFALAYAWGVGAPGDFSDYSNPEGWVVE